MFLNGLRPVLYRCIAQNSRRTFIVGSGNSAENVTKSKSDDQQAPGWIKRMMAAKKGSQFEAEGHSPYSAELSDPTKDVVYEWQWHSVLPPRMDDYLINYESLVKMMTDKTKGNCTLAGSWTVTVGQQDTAIHLWQYNGGYEAMDETMKIYRYDSDFRDFRRNRNEMLVSRRNEIVLPFSFWPEVQSRPPSHIYELRTYMLKPGTMLEWANSWARHLNCRLADGVGIGGFFGNIGDIYHVYHLWAYKDLTHRKTCRELTWARPGWNDNVLQTVPLVRSTISDILIPAPYSPLQ